MTKTTYRNSLILIPVIFSLILFSFLMSSAKALEEDDVVDISQLPAKLAEALNMPLFAGQILASAIPFGLLCFPTFLLTKNSIAHISAIILCLSLTVAFGWLPYWILLLLALIIAFIYANQLKGVFAR